MVETYQNFVAGQWRDSVTGRTFEDRNPADPDDVVARFQRSDVADAEAAVEAAVEAHSGWADRPGPARGEILKRTAAAIDERADELAETLTREEGKTLAESRPEVQRAVEIFHFYGEKAREFRGDVRAPSSRDSRLYTRREPMGVAALITPLNYPIAIPAWKLAPALATGNTVVFKPAMDAPAVATELIECLETAGIPDGVVNLVTGPGSDVGGRFVEDDRVDLVSFTGSKAVGDHVYGQATDGGKRVQTEMGGKNPTIVTSNADLEAAIDIVGAGAFGVTGQACTATSRAIVDRPVYDDFVAGIVDYAESIDVGPGLDGADMGPHVSESELTGTLEYVEIGQSEGATLATGGRRPAVGAGHFVEPTVFADVDPDARIAQEEIFGPVLSVIPVDGFQEAIAVANGVDYGLSASVVTDDLTEANRFVDDIDAGVAKVNEKTTGLELHVPFGGVKDSSSETHREQGEAGLDFYTITKTVYLNY